jgi:CHASE3 domain sensor protein
MYSRTDAKEHMMDQIEDMMSGANEREKEILRRAMEQLEKA